MFCKRSKRLARKRSNYKNFDGERDGTRTHDLQIKSPLLYQLSYAPVGWHEGPPKVRRNIGTAPSAVNPESGRFPRLPKQ